MRHEKNIFFRTRNKRPRHRKQRQKAELGRLADFLANRISAAGLSHVVKAPSHIRRMLWAVVILCTAVAMALMTYRVLQEYLAYPTIMRSKTTAVKELEFPAVTVCGLSPVPKLFAKEAGLWYMEEMRATLNDLPRYSISEVEKTRCLKDPLCYWSWFDDVCLCFQNPCQTLYCYPDVDQSDDRCACSMLMCQWNGSAESCFLEMDGNGGTWCLCRTDFVYPLSEMSGHGAEDLHDAHKPQDLPRSFLDGLASMNTTEQIRDIMGKIKSSKTKDLRDVERFFLPPVSVTDDYGIPADSFILSCSFGVVNCWDLVTLYTPSYGKCYMFNYVGKEIAIRREVRKVEQAGKTFGLQLFVRSRNTDALPLLTRQLGVRLIVHDPRSIPVASEDGVDLRPGDMTSVGLDYTEVHRLGPPWGRCAADGQKLGNYTGDPYRQNDCERECVNMEVFRRCNCFHPKFLRATTIPRRGNICPTNTSFDEDRCFRDTMVDNDRGKIRCDCPPPCREKTYEISMSTSKLNDDFFNLVKMAKSLTIRNDTPSVSDADFESSLMGVQIYYNSLFVTSVNETAIYSWESLVANIGGNMGLFLGISLVTLLEIAEFLTDTLLGVLARRLRERVSPVI